MSAVSETGLGVPFKADKIGPIEISTSAIDESNHRHRGCEVQQACWSVRAFEGAPAVDMIRYHLVLPSNSIVCRRDDGRPRVAGL
jgi:hypothetical protein